MPDVFFARRGKGKIHLVTITKECASRDLWDNNLPHAHVHTIILWSN